MKKTLFILALLITFPSCKKYLELKPQDGLVRQDFWKTKEQVKAAVIGCYASLLGKLSLTLFTWGEIRGDQVSITFNSTADQINASNGIILPSSGLVNWGDVYVSINACNTIIQFAPTTLANDASFSKEQLNTYIAEARGLRALLYFYLLRSFGEVPLQLAAVSSDRDIISLAKSSRAEVSQQIASDLAFAEQNAVFSYGGSEIDKGRLTRYSINAIQADFALWNEDYEACLTACDKIINSRLFGLVEGNSNWFNTLYFKGNSAESIFEFQFGVQLNPFYEVFAGPKRQYTAAPNVVEDLYALDLLDERNRDIRSDFGSFRAADLSIWKYTGSSNPLTARAVGDFNAHWFVYRYAEVLLMKAEALAWTERGDEALGLVALIRERAKALPGTAESPSPINPVEVTDYIMAERARELAFEGKRWYDILRNAKRRNYAHIDYLFDVIVKSAPPERQQSILTKYRDVRSHYFPINANDLNIDKNLVQNPFYQ